jgi:hypothetical protein
MESAGSGGFLRCSEELPRSPGAGSLLPIGSLVFVRKEIDALGRDKMFFRVSPGNGICVVWVVPQKHHAGRKP